MWFAQHFAARVLVWLAAAAIPAQGLPPVPCGCTKAVHRSIELTPSHCCCCARGGASRTSAKGCCGKQRAGRCPCTGAEVCHCGQACASRQPTHECCRAQRMGGTCHCAGIRCHDGDCTCPCGPNCQCGKNNAPPEPAAPPVEHHSPERVLADAIAVASSVTVQYPPATLRHLDVCAAADALAAVDRCVVLCRFTI